jgi:hypothetical protein
MFIKSNLLRYRDESARRGIEHHFFQQALGVVGHGLLVGVDNGMGLSVAEFNEERRTANHNFDLVSCNHHGISRLGQTPTRRSPISFGDRP